MLDTHANPGRPQPHLREPPTTAPPLHTFLPDDGTMEGEVRLVAPAPPAWPWAALLLVAGLAAVAWTAPRAEPGPVELPVASLEESLAAFEAALDGELPPEDRRVLQLAYHDLLALDDAR